MTDFRGPLPLKDRDFAEVRAKVLEKMERRRAPVLAWALAAAAMVALLTIFIPRPHAPAPPHPVQARQPIQPAIVAPTPPAPVQVAEKPQTRKKTKPQPRLVADNGGPPGDEDITMNIQTADPNVRIIWIARR